METCPICLKQLKLAVAHRNLRIAYCNDDNGAWRYVGADCYKHVLAAGQSGWKQPWDFGPRWFADKSDALLAIYGETEKNGG
jgi:hypothetical protein